LHLLSLLIISAICYKACFAVTVNCYLYGAVRNVASV
jgi:hypothetical protein